MRDYPGAILIVTHDRYFLDNVTGWILELDRGRGIPYEGNYSAYLGQKAKRFAQEAREDVARQKVIEREQRVDRRLPKARQAKSKARFKAYDELVKVNEARLKSTTAQIVIPPGERLGTDVIEVENLSKAYGDRLLIEELALQAAARRHRRRDRPERRRQDDAVPHADRRGEARRRASPHRRQRASRLCQPEPRCARSQTRRCGRRSRAATTCSISASAR